jgi:TonB family protein
LPDTVPEADGVYRSQQGLRPARITKAAEAVFPEREAAIEDGCALILVVGEDGKPSRIQVIYSPGKGFDESAIRAVEQSEFEPAYKPSLSHDHPVPTWVDVWVPFHADKQASTPRLLSNLHPDEGPRVLHAVEAEFSDKARKKKVQGTVMLTMLITPDGTPVDLHIVRGLGYGLDENALRAASRYQFKPATKDGKPLPQRISMEVSFRIN